MAILKDHFIKWCKIERYLSNTVLFMYFYYRHDLFLYDIIRENVLEFFVFTLLDSRMIIKAFYNTFPVAR